MTGPMAQ